MIPLGKGIFVKLFPQLFSTLGEKDTQRKCHVVGKCAPAQSTSQTTQMPSKLAKDHLHHVRAHASPKARPQNEQLHQPAIRTQACSWQNCMAWVSCSPKRTVKNVPLRVLMLCDMLYVPQKITIRQSCIYMWNTFFNIPCISQHPCKHIQEIYVYSKHSCICPWTLWKLVILNAWHVRTWSSTLRWRIR